MVHNHLETEGLPQMMSAVWRIVGSNVVPCRFGVERANSGSSMSDYKFTVVATSMAYFTADKVEHLSVKALIDTINAKLNERRRRKRENEGINRRKDTLVKKAFELGEFDGIDVVLIICKYGQYTTFRSKGYVSWQPSFAEIQSTYPLPKNMIPEDMENRRSRQMRKFPKKTTET
ncbi:hypothetical protein ONS95_013653 [Cadophora gregata]|uniref:uncharacterized protein n=1 Tax=Cadophora gregata TaxID=51156 RepID=UPI0026DBD84C|nr:uncharacterized protein ONS95_013653 [Cadophora gregata]KAK0113399.1 hypothetical protein ONS96_014265 [Cadophora gregata f. sp. sojae]KAK0114151.1 hypothetical protein ONS95_013653 [Cadophora gregata]